MISHNFYEEDVSWIDAVTREGTAALDPATPVYSGLFVPGLSPGDLVAVKYARSGGADGVALFTVDSLTEARWKSVFDVIAT